MSNDTSDKSAATDNAATAVRLEVKDLAVTIPLFGSGLAITYEVGSFYPLGSNAFGLFSLSEHLLWALAAFPIVLILLGAFVTVHGFVVVQNFRKSLRKRRPDAGRRYKRKIRLFIISYVAAGAAAVWMGWNERSAFLIALGMGSFICAILQFLPFRIKIERYSGMLSLVAIAFLIAYAVGFDQTRKQLLSGCTAEFAFKDGIKSAVLVRSGERGALLYDPVRNRFTFDKWEDLKRIDWPYISSVQRFSFLPVPADIEQERSACSAASSR